MKNLLFLFFAAMLSFSSCDSAGDPDFSGFPIQYKLVAYQASFIPNPTYVPVSDSLYFYNFYKDGTFQKQVGTEKTEGKFEEVTRDEMNYLELYFDEPESPLIDGCYGGQELLVVKPELELEGTWSHCDGPTLFFKGKAL